MDILSIDLTFKDLQIIRQSLDVITIAGKDAKYLAQLQTRLDKEIQNYTAMAQAAAQKKQQDLNQMISQEEKKKTSSK